MHPTLGNVADNEEFQWDNGLFHAKSALLWNSVIVKQTVLIMQWYRDQKTFAKPLYAVPNLSANICGLC